MGCVHVNVYSHISTTQHEKKIQTHELELPNLNPSSYLSRCLGQFY
jgi:hypothetical protein